MGWVLRLRYFWGWSGWCFELYRSCMGRCAEDKHCGELLKQLLVGVENGGARYVGISSEVKCGYQKHTATLWLQCEVTNPQC